MQEIILDLFISPDEWLKIYRGTARVVRARSVDGRHVQFPANILARYLTRDGIRGRFCIRFDDHGRFASVEQFKAG
ncbi:DUF2835 domain-containing protein [Mangrovitalea sediminis]|uniref:DUF2835 domain-containing protein n=1 Tax=Mangrovitalea sediminis TaxID=1982043 RepID=UPI000BE5838F|nr:DUF2835 domain-containing protein [Mangrovitalea sediminis]